MKMWFCYSCDQNMFATSPFLKKKKKVLGTSVGSSERGGSRE